MTPPTQQDKPIDLEALRLAAEYASPGPWKGDRYDGTVKYELLDANDNTVIMGDNNNNSDGPFGINRYEDEVYLKLAHPAAILALLALIDAQQKQIAEQPGWISVDDDIPEPEIDVLCFDGKRQFIDWFGSKRDCGRGVTHWKALPPAPVQP